MWRRSEEYEAVFTALEGAGTIPDAEWRGNFDPEEYGVDAVHVTEAGDVDEEMFTSIAEEKKYLLLKADTDSGVGEVVPDSSVETTRAESCLAFRSRLPPV